MHIRTATMADLAAITAVEAACFPAAIPSASSRISSMRFSAGIGLRISPPGRSGNLPVKRESMGTSAL